MLASFFRIWTLIVKEFLVIFRDPWGRQMLVTPPLVQLLLFAFAATLEVKNVSLMILNEDLGHHGHEIALRIAASSQFTDIKFVTNSKEFVQAIDEQRIILAVHIPGDFSRKIHDRSGASLQAIYDGRKSNAAQVVDGYLAEIINNYAFELGDQTARGFEVIERHRFNPNLEFHWGTIASLVVIITLIMTMSFSALSLAREKEMGTFEQLLVTPFRPAEILIGKLFPAVLIGVFDAHIIYAVGRIFFAVPFRGSYFLLLATIILFSFSVVSFGLMISSIAKTQQQAILGAFMFMVPAIALSGFASPFENMPLWLQKVMWFNPMKHGVVLLKGIFLKDIPLDVVLANAWPLLVIGVVTILLSGWMFRRNIG
ncbi:MAG: ABC transporter permease [Deltaproteobacteria bacterium]|jgi:ABC-2 type transport system permease protein|nr:ABC transporter permease [Deltaproteobacteria bacterium]